MTIFLTTLCILLAVLLTGQTWLLVLVVRRNESLALELEDKDQQAFHDIRSRLALSERLDEKNVELRSAYTCIEMLFDSEVNAHG